MKKLKKAQKLPLIICGLAAVIAIGVFVVILVTYLQGSANLAKQQQRGTGQDEITKTYEITAYTKDKPEKTLYVPNLVEQLGKSVDQAINDIGHGATVTGAQAVGKPTDKVEKNTMVSLSNEAGDAKQGAPSLVLGTNHAGKITKISFSCNTWALGYGSLSFIDLINNEHVVEKTFREAGLNLEDGKVVAPTNRASYTTYGSDGTTVETESCSFSGKLFQDKHSYKWDSTVTFDYSIANKEGNLSKTVRNVTISVEY